jgi:plasmid stabilization system protein ParE
VDYQIILSHRALQNLEAITAWIARDNRPRAEIFGNELLDRLAILATFPEI